MIAEIINSIIGITKVTCLIAISSYLFALTYKKLWNGPKNPPPCDTCENLARKQKNGPLDKKCWKCEKHGWQYQSLSYCKDYAPRENDEEFDPAESVEED